jgi:hypothetical protein
MGHRCDRTECVAAAATIIIRRGQIIDISTNTAANASSFSFLLYLQRRLLLLRYHNRRGPRTAFIIAIFVDAFAPAAVDSERRNQSMLELMVTLGDVLKRLRLRLKLKLRSRLRLRLRLRCDFESLQLFYSAISSIQHFVRRSTIAAASEQVRSGDGLVEVEHVFSHIHWYRGHGYRYTESTAAAAAAVVISRGGCT